MFLWRIYRPRASPPRDSRNCRRRIRYADNGNTMQFHHPVPDVIPSRFHVGTRISSHTARFVFGFVVSQWNFRAFRPSRLPERISVRKSQRYGPYGCGTRAVVRKVVVPIADSSGSPDTCRPSAAIKKHRIILFTTHCYVVMPWNSFRLPNWTIVIGFLYCFINTKKKTNQCVQLFFFLLKKVV